MNRFESIARPVMWFMTLLLVALAAGCGSGSESVSGSSTPSSAKAITAYSLDGSTGTINEVRKTIAVTKPFGTDVIALVATFTTTGTNVNVGTTPQVSATTPNNFTSPVMYTVTAADGTTVNYTVTVTVATSSAKTITAYSLDGSTGIINETTKTIAVTKPFGTDVTAMVATFTTTGASVKVGTAVQTSATTANNFTSPVAYIVTAANSTTATYTVTVTVAASSAKTITAYSLDGSTGIINETTKTIAVTKPFGTDVTALVATFTTTAASVKVGTAAQTSATTPNNFTSPVVYTVTAANSTTSTYTVTVTVAANFAKSITAYSLDGTAGVVDETAKTISVIMPYGTDVTAMVATFTSTGTGPVTVGGVAQESGTTANNFTTTVAYIVTAANSTTATYTVTVTVAANFAKAITAYSFVGFNSAGTINETATPKTITVTVPYGTDVTALVATFTTTGASVTVGATPQLSAATVNNFTSPVTYTVTAADNSTADYIVTATPGVVLGLAAPFASAAKSGLVNVGATTINGNVLLDPNQTCNSATLTASGDFTGCGGTAPTLGGTSKVISTLYTGGGNIANIKSDLEAAFLSITPLAGPPAAGTLGGGTPLAATTIGGARASALVQGVNLFAPGVYTSGSTIDVTGDITLDAGGNANAVFVFQAGSTLTVIAGGTTTNTRILLTGSAKASNVWWQVGSSATIGTYAEFQGSVLAAVDITMQTGATACGRLLGGAWAGSSLGVVTFGTNIVSVPGQAFAPPAGYSTICQ